MRPECLTATSACVPCLPTVLFRDADFGLSALSSASALVLLLLLVTWLRTCLALSSVHLRPPLALDPPSWCRSMLASLETLRTSSASYHGVMGVPTKTRSRVGGDLLWGNDLLSTCNLNSARLADMPMEGLWAPFGAYPLVEQ